MGSFSALLALCVVNPLIVDGFPAQRANNADLSGMVYMMLARVISFLRSDWEAGQMRRLNGPVTSASLEGINTDSHKENGYVEGSIHYNDVIMNAIESQFTSLTIVYSVVYSGRDQRKHQSSVSLAFVRGIHRWPYACVPHFNLWRGHKHPCSFQLRIALNLKSTRHYMGIDLVPYVKSHTSAQNNCKI